MKRKILTILFCLILVFGMAFISCDNGDFPKFEAGDIEAQFMKDHDFSSTDLDFFDGLIADIMS